VPATTIEVVGMDKLLKSLGPEKAKRASQTAMRGATDLVRAEVKRYPPASEANQARRFNTVYSIRSRRPVNQWYIRGEGTRRVRKDGSVVKEFGSEKLGASWYKKVGFEVGYLTGLVGTNVSYARWVQDKERQVGFHKARGWKTVQDVAAQQTKHIMRLFEQALTRALQL
jgi:hypothetical protein